MKMDLKPYDAAFFAWHERFRAEYTELAKYLHAIFKPATACDLGCGSGYLVADLADLGVAVMGVEKYKDAALASIPKAARAIIYKDDLCTDAYRRLPSADLVTCIEVAEHLPRRFASRLVNNCVRVATKYIFFTAATPGQGGYNHVNEETHEYWISKFGRRGWVLDDNILSRAVLFDICPGMSWIGKNAMVFVPRS